MHQAPATWSGDVGAASQAESELGPYKGPTARDQVRSVRSSTSNNFQHFTKDTHEIHGGTQGEPKGNPIEIPHFQRRLLDSDVSKMGSSASNTFFCGVCEVDALIPRINEIAMQLWGTQTLHRFEIAPG